ncbi:MAG: O-antigen ligase family protein [Candidatus Liptonbacteria bacterium]|nr:O-antigen ligase family protein [Candidatus Liptonbacteria bacterium]
METRLTLSDVTDRYLPSAVRILLVAAALIPFVYIQSMLFPLVFSKAVVFRLLVEFSLVLLCVRAILLWGQKKPIVFPFPFKNPLVLLLIGFFVLSAGISTIFAENAYRAFWGDVDRAEGFLGLLHYVAFFIMTVGVFRARDWIRFSWIAFCTGIVVSFYAWLQYGGVDVVARLLGATVQPGSFIGNPAYLAGYAILVAGIAAVLLSAVHTGRFLRYALWSGIAFELATVFITQTRGAIIGVGAGVVAALVLWAVFAGRGITLWKYSAWTWAVGAFVLLTAFGGIFWMTRAADIWQDIPGIRRFARTEILEVSSVATRIIALKTSWRAFLDRPVIGWGPENYNIAYNTKYDSSYAYYAEDWFDRAHNKIAEVAVTQGIVGLALYFGVFGFLATALYRLRSAEPQLTLLLSAVFVAYITQNLFLFDSVVTYIFFLALVGFVVWREEQRKREVRIPRDRLWMRVSVLAFSGVAVVVLIAAAYWYNLLPAYQTRAYILAMRARVGEKILAAADSFLLPYTYAQSTIRAQFSDSLYDNGLFRDPQFRNLTDRAIAAMEELNAREPYEPRNYIRLIETYSDYAKRDPSYLPRAETYARRAVELAPGRQGVLYHLAFILAAQGKYDEAFEIARQAVDLDPRVYKSQYQLGIVYSLYADSASVKGTAVQTEYRRKTKEQFEKAWTMAGEQNDYGFFLLYDFNNIVTIHRVFNDNVNAAKVLEVAIPRHPTYEKFYVDAVAVYRALREKEKLIAAAKKLQELNPVYKDDLDVIIDLTEKEKWNILDTL